MLSTVAVLIDAVVNSEHIILNGCDIGLTTVQRFGEEEENGEFKHHQC